jgi:hypothetical protein
MADPFDGLIPVDNPAPLNRPIIRKGVEPGKPDLPQGWRIDPKTGQAERVPGLPSGFTEPKADKANSGDLPQGWRFNEQTGKAEPVPGLPAGLVEQPPGAAGGDVFQNDVLLKQIAHLRELAKKPFSLGTGTGYLSYVPVIGQNAANMRAGLDQVKGDLIQRGIQRLRELNGGKGAATMANTEKEGERIAASFAPLSADQSPEEFIRGLDTAEQFYRGALQKAAGAQAPQPQQQQPPPLVPKDNGITGSSPLAIGDPAEVRESSTQKTKVNPWLQKYGPSLMDLLKQDPRKVSNAMILGWIKKNGYDPSQLENLPENLKFRTSPDRRGAVYEPSFTPLINEPLSTQMTPGQEAVDTLTAGMLGGSEQTQAERSGSSGGAYLAGLADTGTVGALPELAGIVGAVTGEGYSKARADFKDKQNLLAYEHPTATTLGNLTGGLTTVGLGAPATFPRLIGQTGGLGALYGFLSSDDSSFGGRLENAVTSGATSAAAAGIGDPALRGIGAAGRKLAVNPIRRLLGTSADDLASEDALRSFATHAPNQDVPQMRNLLSTQGDLGAEPTGLTTLNRAGQDYLGRQAARSPGAREAADVAAGASREKLPGQIEQDFNQAIDDAAGGDKNVATFLKRPSRDITADIQDMAGREYEAGIDPIKDEPLAIDGDLADALTHERIKGAVADALTNHSLSDQTRQVLRQLPRSLQEADIKAPSTPLGGKAAEQVAAMQAQVRDQTLKGIPLTVDAARNLATALDRTASRLADGSEGVIELRRLSSAIRQKIGEQYPEFNPVNARYASRMRAIGALDDARSAFLGDEAGTKTDDLAKATSRMSDQPGEPEFKGAPAGTNGFQVSKPPQATPSQKQMAIAGAREAAVAKASNGDAAAAAEQLSGVGQKERNRMILGERAAQLEARSKAQAANVRTTDKLASGGTADDAGSKVAAGMKAVANLGFHRGGAAIASALSGIRGLGPDDAARVVKLYTDPNKAEAVISSLEKAYGRRKARFIIARIAALSTAAGKTKQLPDEAVQ